MKYALEERIGNPDLFVGRKNDLNYFINWINDIKEKKSKSTAILARRKMGKTALLERLYNITFASNSGVIPFYYEIKEQKMWVGDFCLDFCFTFIYQYIAFKTRKIEYLHAHEEGNFKKARQVVAQEGLDYLTDLIDGVENSFRNKQIGILWNIVSEAPKNIAALKDEFIVQMIDEFQFINDKIYLDKALRRKQDDMAAGYLGTAESKVAPLLVSGSWVGWLMNMLAMMLPSRFRYYFIENMPEEEAIEMIYNYTTFFKVPLTEEIAYLIEKIAEGSPFYISSIIRSGYKDKNLTTIEGLTKTLEYETLDNRGEIKFTWMEYISSALSRINDRNAKNIVLYLCKHREREVTRKELLDNLKLDMTDSELELKLKALVKSDIIVQGRTNFDYRGVKDNIFDKVFRGVYEKEIREFDICEIGKEFNQEFLKLKDQYIRLLGKYSNQKGHFAEYMIIDRLMIHGSDQNEILKSITRNLPTDFNFCNYTKVWKYDASPIYSKNFNIDIYARAINPDDYSIIGEVKSRDLKSFSKEEAQAFELKYQKIKEMEKLERAVAFVFSRSGFSKEAENFCKEKGIAISEDMRWLDDSF